MNWTSEIIYGKNTSSDEPKGDIPIDIGLISGSDENYFIKSDRYSNRDIEILLDADYCIVARDGSVPVHHTCVTVGKGFQHPRKDLELDIENDEGYIYNVKTETEYRGQGVAPYVFTYIQSLLSEVGVNTVYAEVDTKNRASKRTFIKSGYKKHGSVRIMKYGTMKITLVTGLDFYKPSYKIPLIDKYVSRSTTSELVRISEEIRPLLADWNEEGDSIVLFGVGNHALHLLQTTELERLTEYAVDDAKEKTNTEIGDSGIPVREVSSISEQTPDVVIVCSQAFQSEMVSRIREYTNSTEIVVLYPHVGYN